MMSSKQLVFVALFVTLAAVAVNATILKVGERKASDKKLWGLKVVAMAGSGQYTTFPISIDVGNHSIINQIVAKVQDNNGATAKLTSGGPGSSTALFNITSAVGGNLNFMIDVFGQSRYPPQ